MQAKRFDINCIMTMIPIVFFTILSSAYHFSASGDIIKFVIVLGISAAVVFWTVMMREKYLLKFFPYALVLVMAFLMLYNFFGDFYVSQNVYVDIGLPFMVNIIVLFAVFIPAFAYCISEFNESFLNKPLLVIIILGALSLAVLYNATHLVLMFVGVTAIVLFLMCKDGMLKIKPSVLFGLIFTCILLLFTVLVIVYSAAPSSLLARKLLSRFPLFNLDEFYANEMVQAFREVLSSVKFMGNADVKNYYFMNNCFMTSLTQFGWIGLIIMLLVYAVFFAFLCNMIKEIKQSRFARYTAVISGLFLLIQVPYGLLSVFGFFVYYIEFPFLSGISTFDIVNFALWALILSLYFDRKKEIEA